MARPIAKRRTRTVCLTAALVVYCVAYLVMSRVGFAAADQLQAEGFWFVQPGVTPATEDYLANEALRIGFYPLLVLDETCGAGRPAAGWPISGLQ